MDENAISGLVGATDSTPGPVEELKEAPNERVETPEKPTQANSETDTQADEPAESSVPDEPTSDTATITEPDPGNAQVETTPEQKVDAVLAKLVSLIGDNVGAESNFKIMVYGAPGSTKTSFALTAPDNLVWDLEDGLISGASSPHGIARNVRPMPYINWTQGEAISRKLAEKPAELDWCKVFTVDTLSRLSRTSLGEITTEAATSGRIRSQYKAETDENTENNEKLDRWVNELKSHSGRDIILLCHERTVEPKNKPSLTYPDFSESLANKLEAHMDVVGRMTLEQIDDKIVPVMTLKAVGIHCKSRLGLPDQIIDPTWPQLKAAWQTTMDKLKSGV